VLSSLATFWTFSFSSAGDAAECSPQRGKKVTLVVRHLTQDRSITQGGDESRVVGTWDRSITRISSTTIRPLGVTISRSNMWNLVYHDLRTLDDPVSAVLGPYPLFFRPDNYGGWFIFLAYALHAAAGELYATRPSLLRCSELWKANPIIYLDNTPPLRLQDAVKAARPSKSVPFTWTDCEVPPLSFRSHN